MPHTDTQEARELFLFATNDGQLYRSRITPIIDNLKKKIKKGAYDKVLALKLWRYAADDAAKRYNAEFEGTRAGYGIWTVPIRNEVATLLQEYYDEELHYAGNPAPRLGTSRPRRASQITKKAPTKRLVARRKANTQKGYFPNPTGRVFTHYVSQTNPKSAMRVPEMVCLTLDATTAAQIVDVLNAHRDPSVVFRSHKLAYPVRE